MPNRPRKTPAQTGRRATIDLLGVMGALGALTGAEPVGNLIQPEGPVTEEMAQAGATRLPPQVDFGKAPSRWQNLLTRGQAGENYRRAVTSEALRQAELQTALQQEAARRSFQENLLEKQFANQVSLANLEAGIQADTDNRRMAAEQAKFDKLAAQIGANYWRDRGVEFTPEMALATGTELLVSQQQLEAQKARAAASIPISEFNDAVQQEFLAERAKPGIANRRSLVDINAIDQATRHEDERFKGFRNQMTIGSYDTGQGLLTGVGSTPTGFMPFIPGRPTQFGEITGSDGLPRKVVLPGTIPSVGFTDFGSVDEVSRMGAGPSGKVIVPQQPQPQAPVTMFKQPTEGVIPSAMKDWGDVSRLIGSEFSRSVAAPIRYGLSETGRFLFGGKPSQVTDFMSPQTQAYDAWIQENRRRRLAGQPLIKLDETILR